MYVGGGLVLLVLIIVLIVRRRHKALPIGTSEKSRGQRTAMTQRFDFDFSRDVQRWNRLFAVNSRSAYLLVDDGDLIAHFGPWTLTTTLNNIVDATITGPYRLWRVAGPARLSFADRGLTFATTTRTGLCLTFRSPVPGIDPLGIFRHPNLTVTVKDPRALAQALGFTESSTTTGHYAPSV